MFNFFSSCVGWLGDVESLKKMVNDAVEITRRTFLKYVNKKDLKKLEKDLMYDRSFPMCRDWHVSYCKSKLDGETVYYFCHSHIEYVFTNQPADVLIA